MKIPLIKPFIPSDVFDVVTNVLNSGFLTEGSVTAQFEKAIADYTGARHCIAVTSCTTGLELALRAAGVGSGDEVIVPDYTYPATASVVNIVGAKAVIVDISAHTMLIDYDAIERAITPRTKAVIPVSLFGNPMDWDRLAEIKKKYSLYIIEDAACSLGSCYDNKMTGIHADATVFSHHPRKFITTGEGGTIVTNNDEWACWMTSYKHFGMRTDGTRLTTEFVQTGTNYKLSNVLAAIGLSQMKHIDVLLQRRQELATRYTTELKDIEGILIPETTKKGKHSNQSYCIFIKNRDQVMKKLRGMGIEAQIGTYSLHMHKAFKNSSEVHIAVPPTKSRQAFEQTLALPLYHEMSDTEHDTVCRELKSCISKLSSPRDQ